MNRSGIEWVKIPGGSFIMGSKDIPEAQPLHRVSVKPFEMAKTLVTNRQYKACVAAGACPPADISDCLGEEVSALSSFQGDDQPVACVDWDQVQTFAQWVGGRLPSEAEWEYAARSAGKDQKYPWGNEDATCEKAVMTEGCGRGATWPVCSKPKGNTEQGLCDMAGNVWEWIQDEYHNSYEGAPTDGSAWQSPPGSARVPDRVIRGGSWDLNAGFLRSAYWDGVDPRFRYSHVGFRLVRLRR